MSPDFGDAWLIKTSVYTFLILLSGYMKFVKESRNNILQSFNPMNHSSDKHIIKNARDKNATFIRIKTLIIKYLFSF